MQKKSIRFIKQNSEFHFMLTTSSQWFNIISTVYHIISFFVAGAISLLGYKAYKLLKEKKYLNFAVAFFFIMLSFVVLAVTNLLVYFNLGANVAKIVGIINWGFVIFTLLTICGFFLLVLLSFKINDIKIISIVSIIIVTSLILFDFIKMFHLILLLFSLLLSYHFYKNCREKKTTNSKLVFLAFTAIMISHIFSIASGANELIFAIGSTILVFGYILLLTTLLRLK